MEQCARFFRLTAVGLLGQLLRTQACNQLSSIYIYTIYDFIYITTFGSEGLGFALLPLYKQRKEHGLEKRKERQLHILNFTQYLL